MRPVPESFYLGVTDKSIVLRGNPPVSPCPVNILQGIQGKYVR